MIEDLDHIARHGIKTPDMAAYLAPGLFSAASLLPAGCLLAGAAYGGVWPIAAILSISVLVIAMDRYGPGFEASAALSGWLPHIVGSLHLLTLTATLWAIGSDTLKTIDKVLLVIGMGLYAGQVSNACAHELIHRGNRLSRNLGTAIYSSIFNGQHVSAHLLVHHPHAGTIKDPNSAPLGRGFYRFARDATLAEFKQGWLAETDRRLRNAKGPHPYLIYLSGALISMGIAIVLSGSWAMVALFAISVHAQLQLMMSDYVQHYGLRRALQKDGKPEPMGPHHSWNAARAYSAALMMNAPRHSDHHMAPSRPFSELKLDIAAMPILPYSLPVMGAIALAPSIWHRIMDPHVLEWSNQLTPQEIRDPIQLSTSASQNQESGQP